MELREQYSYVDSQSRKQFAKLNGLTLYHRPPKHLLSWFLGGKISIRQLEAKLKKFYQNLKK
tara:strand:+ start:332 stop:517 length:186 start_codon:yes stop_codon:yes gene_type:complete